MKSNLLYDYKVNKYVIVSYHNGKNTVSLYGYGYSIKKNIKQETRIYVEVLFNEKIPSGNRKKMSLLLDQVMAASFDQDCIEGEPALHIYYLNRNRNDCSLNNLCCFYNMKKLQ